MILNRRSRISVSKCLVGVGLLLEPSLLLSQGTARGTLVGTVSDSSGAVVPGVTITVLNVDTGIQQRSLTSEAGVYAHPNLPAGTYRVTGEMKGFQQAVVDSVQLEVGATYRADIVLQVGDVGTQVTVNADTP